MAIERAGAEEGDGGGGDPDTDQKCINIITLNHGEHQDSTLYRFEKGCYVHFCPGPTLLGRKVFLHTNYTEDDDDAEEEPARGRYSCLRWRGGAGEAGESGGALVTRTDVYCELRLRRAGPLHYYFIYENAEGGPAGSGWVQCAPGLVAGGAALPLDGVLSHTVLTKCLGPLARWRRVLAVSRHAGYNMIHFTPVQELGASGSSYSVADQLQLSAALQADWGQLRALVSELREQWGVLCICDVVLNHTANETPWLAAHPDATYNVALCPHLRPAALLDAALARLSRDVAAGREPHVPAAIATEEHIQAMERAAWRRVDELRLHEMYACDVDRLAEQFRTAAAGRLPGAGPGEDADPLVLRADPQRRRGAATVDMDAALRLYNVYRSESATEAERVRACEEQFRRRLSELNAAAEEEVRGHLRAALANVAAGARYQFLQRDGPRAPSVSDTHPLAAPYFLFPAEALAAAPAQLEQLVYGARGALVMAHNGWVMNGDPLHDFAARDQDGRVYLRRELIAWGDSVKLRYGSEPADSPWLWAHMAAYVAQTADVFDGLRLDNCHSTPLPVAERMLRAARRRRPDLYVVAELFTDCDLVDNIFVNRLGITSLIREAQSAWDAHEQGRLVHRYGGRAVGSWPAARRGAARPSVAHALLLDLTHDNPSPLDKRSIFDTLPSAALVAMACCATGSTRGLDELVPHHVHVVDESRLYPEWGDPAQGAGHVDATCGFISARRALNRLHLELAVDGYSEVYVDQMDEDVVAVTRHHPVTRRSVILVACTSFRPPDATGSARTPRPLRFEGRLESVLLEATLRGPDAEPYSSLAVDQFERHPRYVNGLRTYAACVETNLPFERSRVFAEMTLEGAQTVLRFRPLAAGTVVAVRVSPGQAAAGALATLHALDARRVAAALVDALAGLDAADMRAALYCCEGEERECTGGAGGVYHVPGHGPLVYAGLQGVVSLVEELRAGEPLGHALCDNLRAGDWLPEYTWRRLAHYPRLAALADCYRHLLRPLADLPRFLVPAYYVRVVSLLHACVAHAALARLAPRLVRADSFTRALALTSVALVGHAPSASLPHSSAPTLSAGLPHFATGYMRCWGRDTFISLRGLLLLPARYEDARAHILGFAACLRHGLIPNLLDGGCNARYNCRDAVWWWLYSIKQYCSEAPDGFALLTERVARLFPADDSEPALAASPTALQPLHDVMQEALDAHFQGRAFRERRAGRDIDAHMTDRGFHVQVGIDPDTGFPFGGNDANCGTWMDKMGSSERAGNRGKPATPRDGSAVELVGLAHAVASWLATAHRDGRYPYPGLVRKHRDGSLTSWTFSQWADRIRSCFERHFWVPAAPSATDARPDLVHRRAIYKDSHNASQPWADYQLRCNFPIAMVVAPDLFDPRHAWQALDQYEKLLLGPLGVKTLDPADWSYRPDYDNANDSDDPSVAHGFNYHQGPEWVWPIGFYLRARIAFAHDNDRYARTIAAIYATLGPHVAEIQTSPWRGLPELTNANGAPCEHSCRSQAWSSACVLEVLHDLEEMQRARPLPPD